MSQGGSDEEIIPFGAVWDYKLLGVWKIGGSITGPSSKRQARENIRPFLKPFVTVHLVLSI